VTLESVSAAYNRAHLKAERLRLERDELIVEALKAGVTHAKIAEATGLTRGRIGQFAQEMKK
jgi:hypothetical protein